MKVANRFFVMLCCILSITYFKSFAQQENIWAFGIHAGLDFNTGTPVAINTNLTSNEGCASVCNLNGQLQFYTNGERVWDRFGNFMQNGFSICSLTTTSTTQGVLIVPMPDSSSKFYIFSLTAIENMALRGRLYYSVVNMELNNGLGAVEANRTQILVDTGLQEDMTAVAGNNCNIWLLTIAQQGTLKAFNIDYNGINYTPVQSPVIVGSGTSSDPKPGGMCVSPNRSKLAVADLGLTLYDFNPTTGMVSNPLGLSTSAAPVYYSTCFSPDNSKLYATQLGYNPLEQFDLSSGIPTTIASSMIPMSSITTPTQTLKLAPDGKIYGAQPGSFLAVINQPNQSGAAAMFSVQGFALSSGTSAYLGLPNVVPHLLPTGDTLFSKQVIDVTECFTNTFQLHADTMGIGMIWDNGSTSPHRIINEAGTYWVRYSKHCVVYSDTFVVHFPNATPQVLIYPACKGSRNGIAVASSANSGYIYTWRDEALNIMSTTDSLLHAAGGNYTLHVVTPSGCDTTINIIIPEEVHIASFLADSIVCQGSQLNFTNSSDNYFSTYTWTFGDGDSSLVQNPSHTYINRGHYAVTLIASGVLCVDTAHKTILVDSMFNGHFRLTPDSICKGQTITFFPDTDISIKSLHWFYGDGQEMTGPGEDEVHHAYDTDGTLPVQLTTTYRACPTTLFSDTVYVYPLPNVDLGNDTGLCLGAAPILLENLQPASLSAYHNTWNTGDTTAVIKVVHPGTYSLTVSSGPLGCSTTESIIIHKDCYIDIPNAFTPNGDGENDYFFPRQLLSRRVTGFRMQILNRWGQLIFETNSIDGRGWDGRLNGATQPQGVYVYLIDVTIDSNKEERYNGNVTLIR